MKKTTLPILCSIATLCVMTATAQAQDQKQVTLTTEQIELNNKAVKALNAKKADVAIDYMRAALREEGQRANILYLTLGRAYQIKGQCGLAKKNFKLAETTASVTGVPKNFVSDKLTTYRKEMAPLCPGTLYVKCQDPRVKLTITANATQELIRKDKKPPRCDDKLTIPKGEYTITAVAGKKTETKLVSIKGDQTSLVSVSIKSPPEESIPTNAIIVGASTLVLSGGIWGYHFYARNQGEENYKNYAKTTTDKGAAEQEAIVNDWAKKARYANRAAWGVAITGTVATLAIIFWPKDEQPTPSQPSSTTGNTSWQPLVAPSKDGLWLGGQLRW